MGPFDWALLQVFLVEIFDPVCHWEEVTSPYSFLLIFQSKSNIRLKHMVYFRNQSWFPVKVNFASLSIKCLKLSSIYIRIITSYLKMSGMSCRIIIFLWLLFPKKLDINNCQPEKCCFSSRWSPQENNPPQVDNYWCAPPMKAVIVEYRWCCNKRYSVTYKQGR